MRERRSRSEKFLGARPKTFILRRRRLLVEWGWGLRDVDVLVVQRVRRRWWWLSSCVVEAKVLSRAELHHAHGGKAIKERSPETSCRL